MGRRDGKAVTGVFPSVIKNILSSPFSLIVFLALSL